MPQSAITFDETGFERQGEHDGVLIWSTPRGDMLGLFHYAIPPDIHADLSNIDSVRTFFRQSANEVGLGIIEVETVVVDQCTAVRTLFKAAQEAHGRTYLGTLTFPFRDFSYVLKVQCEEGETTGMRDTAVMMKLMMSGKAQFDTESKGMTGWLDDPYDPNETGPMTRNKSERTEYDADFPDHPLSRARSVLDHLVRTVVIDETIKKQPGFFWQG